MPLQELFNLRWYIQHLIDQSGYDYGYYYLDNPLNEDNLMLQTNRKFMKYVIFTLQSMNNVHVSNNPMRSIIKAIPYHNNHTDEGESTNQKCDMDEGESAKDEGESTTSTELSEGSISDTPTASSEDSKPIETPQYPTEFNKSRCDRDPSEDKPMTEFEPLKENGEQIIVQENKLLSTNYTVKTQN